MSKISDMAKAEAEAAEAENPDAEENEPLPPDPADSEEEEEAEEEAAAESEAEDSPATEQEMESALDSEAARHLAVLESLMPDLRETFEPCSYCGTLGYRAQGRPPMDDTLDECPKCQGYGVVQTPSKAEGHVFEQCSQCHGNGHVIRIVPPTPVQAYPGAQVTMPPQQNGEADAFYAEAARRGLLVTPLGPPAAPQT